MKDQQDRRTYSNVV